MFEYQGVSQDAAVFLSAQRWSDCPPWRTPSWSSLQTHVGRTLSKITNTSWTDFLSQHRDPSFLFKNMSRSCGRFQVLRINPQVNVCNFTRYVHQYPQTNWHETKHFCKKTALPLSFHPLESQEHWCLSVMSHHRYFGEKHWEIPVFSMAQWVANNEALLAVTWPVCWEIWHRQILVKLPLIHIWIRYSNMGSVSYSHFFLSRQGSALCVHWRRAVEVFLRAAFRWDFSSSSKALFGCLQCTTRLGILCRTNSLSCIGYIVHSCEPTWNSFQSQVRTHCPFRFHLFQRSHQQIHW